MIVKDTIRISTAFTINIPLSVNSIPVSKGDDIKSLIIREQENSVNPIIDLEKSRYSPVNMPPPLTAIVSGITEVTYNLLFLTGDTTTGYTNAYEKMETPFTADDINKNRNNFKHSFLRLNFYDNNLDVNKRLLFFITIFAQDHGNYFAPSDPNLPRQFITGFIDKKPIGDTNNDGIADTFKTKFEVASPLFHPEKLAEGFYLHWLRNDVFITGTTRDIYMEAQFANAKTGVIHNFMAPNNSSIPTTLISANLVKYVRYTLDTTTYNYHINEDPGIDVTYNGGSVTVQLREFIINS